MRSQAIEHSSMFMAEIEGMRWSFPVTSADCAQTPRWKDPVTSAPPLSIAEAIAVAGREVPRYVSEAARWHVSGVALHSFGVGDMWFYVVSYRPAGEVTGDSLPIPVLMSGQAVTGSRRERP